jgi:hypothetical protein
MGILMELRQKAPSSYQTLSIEIGDIKCALKCKDARLRHRELFRRLKKLYQTFLTKEKPDITIELEATENVAPTELDNALSETKYMHDNNAFQTTSDLMAGEYDLAHQSIKITGEKSLADPNLEMNLLNRLISLAYYSACKIKHNGLPPAMLVHACGILRHGHVWLFVGPSGAGKTTVARLCGKNDGEVINDEMVLLARSSSEGAGINVQSAPILGRFPSRRKVTAPLSGILLLKKGLQTQTQPVDRTRAYLTFMRQIITPAYIGQKDRREVYSLMADFSSNVTNAVPMFELEFNMDNQSLWQTIAKLEEKTVR